MSAEGRSGHSRNVVKPPGLEKAARELKKTKRRSETIDSARALGELPG
jgi:hypothetical protein